MIAEVVAVLAPGNARRLYARDHLTLHDALIGVSVVPGGLASPQAPEPLMGGR